MSISRSGFTVGMLAAARCTSDTPVAILEWLTNGVVVESAMATQTLDLIIPMVNDSIHGDVFVCRVTRDNGMIATQNFTMDVDGKYSVTLKFDHVAIQIQPVFLSIPVPSDSLRASMNRSGTARAGMVYNLTCTVSKVDGLINFPTATWTTGSGGATVSNGNDVTVYAFSDDTTATSTLTFDPLRTSHNGVYTCIGSLISSALQMPLTTSAVEEHRVQSK